MACKDDSNDVLNRLYENDGNDVTITLEYAAYMN